MDAELREVAVVLARLSDLGHEILRNERGSVFA